MIRHFGDAVLRAVSPSQANALVRWAVARWTGFVAPDETRVEVGVAPDGSAWRTSTLLALSSVGTDAFALDAFGEVPPVVSAIAGGFISFFVQRGDV
jgi:hypothetical protein